jgi:hypothetical protein
MSVLVDCLGLGPNERMQPTEPSARQLMCKAFGGRVVRARCSRAGRRRRARWKCGIMQQELLKSESTMPMMIVAFGFPFPFAPRMDELRAHLGAEIGRRRAGESNVEIQVDTDQFLDRSRYREAGLADYVSFCSMDIIALVYVEKTCLSMGGTSVRFASGKAQHITIPEWAKTPWVALGSLTKLRIHLGTIRLSHEHGSHASGGA